MGRYKDLTEPLAASLQDHHFDSPGKAIKDGMSCLQLNYMGTHPSLSCMDMKRDYQLILCLDQDHKKTTPFVIVTG